MTPPPFDFWMFLGGLGLFLLAMSQLEAALRALSGRSLRRFLQEFTGSALRAVGVGALTTALVQSSSLVGLMVLAFVGASVLSLESALGIIFGANLGTTLTGWVVTTLGFKLDLERAALPLIGFGALFLTGYRSRIREAGRIAAAIGLLIFGLSLMKDSVDGLAETIDIERFADYAAWQFLAFGVVFAAVVQSSSATMLVALTALSSGIITLPAAAAIAVGADLGTTSTVLLGAVQGEPVKKRAALAHLLFNLTTTVFAFALLKQLLALVALTGLSDPLYQLVAFHSLFNFMGIVVLLPFIRPLARFLERRFTSSEVHESHFVSETPATVSAAAVNAVEQETAHLIGRVIQQNLYVFSPPVPLPPGESPVPIDPGWPDETSGYDDMYRRNKHLEGEILTFASTAQQHPNEPEQTERLAQLLSAVRDAVQSAKSLTDVQHNLEAMIDATQPAMRAYHDHFRAEAIEFYGLLFRLAGDHKAPAVVHDFAQLKGRMQQLHDQMHRVILADVRKGRLGEHEISTLLNVNREMLNSHAALTMALQDLSLADAEARALNEISAPG